MENHTCVQLLITVTSGEVPRNTVDDPEAPRAELALDTSKNRKGGS